MMEPWSNNICLLLLQIVLERQQSLAHTDKTLELSQLLIEPVIDINIWTKFITQPIVIYYSPKLQDIKLEELQKQVDDLFQIGFPSDCKEFEDVEITVISLANFYSMKRIDELENEKLPFLKNEILQNLTGVK